MAEVDRVASARLKMPDSLKNAEYTA